MATQEAPHIGNIIGQYLKANGIRVSWLAEQLGCHRNNVYHILRRSWIDTTTLMRISRILHHDFNADLSEWYNDKEGEVAAQ